MENYDYDFAREVGRRLNKMTPDEIKSWSQPVPGPKQPLDEKDAEIARLRDQIVAKDTVLLYARDWLVQYRASFAEVGGESELLAALETALWPGKGER